MINALKSNSNEFLYIFGRDFDSFSTCTGHFFTNKVPILFSKQSSL